MLKRIRLKQLDAVPKEYFFEGGFNRKILNSNSVLWSGFCICLFFTYLTITVVYLGGVDFPLYAEVSLTFLWVLLLLLFISCVVFSSKKIAFGHPDKFLMVIIFAFFNFTIGFWGFLTFFTMLLAGSGDHGRIDPARGIFIFSWFVLLLLLSFIVLVWLTNKMRQKVIEGEYRRGGGGLMGHFRGKNKLPAIGAAVFSLTITLNGISMILSKLGVGFAWDNAYTPLLVTFSSILAGVMLVTFAYTFATTTIRIYCVRRFGTKIFTEENSKKSIS